MQTLSQWSIRLVCRRRARSRGIPTSPIRRCPAGPARRRSPSLKRSKWRGPPSLDQPPRVFLGQLPRVFPVLRAGDDARLAAALTQGEPLPMLVGDEIENLGQPSRLAIRPVRIVDRRGRPVERTIAAVYGSAEEPEKRRGAARRDGQHAGLGRGAGVEKGGRPRAGAEARRAKAKRENFPYC
jgi:hypothetical protein